MDVQQQQPGGARNGGDGVDILNFEIVVVSVETVLTWKDGMLTNLQKVDIKKEIQNIKDSSAQQKRLKEKYPKLDGM